MLSCRSSVFDTDDSNYYQCQHDRNGFTFFLTSFNSSSGRASDPRTVNFSNMRNKIGSWKLRQQGNWHVRFLHPSFKNLEYSKNSCSLIFSVVSVMLVAWFQRASTCLWQACEYFQSYSAKNDRASASEFSNLYRTEFKDIYLLFYYIWNFICTHQSALKFGKMPTKTQRTIWTNSVNCMSAMIRLSPTMLSTGFYSTYLWQFGGDFFFIPCTCL